MSGYLNKVDIEIEIYQYDPVANDDLYQSFKSKFIDINDNNIQLQTGLRLQYIKLIKEALSDPKINQLNQLAKVNGIGDKTLEKAFALKDKLVFVDVYVDQSEHVYPMLVSPNGSMKDMWLSRGKKT